MARLPTVGGDSGNWGTVLNEFLAQAHTADGKLRLDVATIADLKALSVSTIPDKMQVMVGGYYAHGDGGGGQFYYDAASSTTDNAGTVIAPTAGSGRWNRIYSGAVNVKWFGARVDGSTDDTAAFVLAQNGAAGCDVIVPEGTAMLYDFVPITGLRLRGQGRGTVLKLKSGATVNHHVISGVSGSPINNVYISDLTLNGNHADHGLENVSMHGIAVFGNHDGWIIDRIHAFDFGGCGISLGYTVDLASAPSNNDHKSRYDSYLL